MRACALAALVLFVACWTFEGCGGSSAHHNRRRLSRWEKMRREAERLCAEGDEKLREAMVRKRKYGQRAADPYFEEARQCFEQALGLYRRLDEEFPGKFRPAIQGIQERLYEINKEKGFGE